MSDVNYLDAMFPALGKAVARTSLANLPTPVQRARIEQAGRALDISIKRDDLSSAVYGGNKVRKLEYLLNPRTSHVIKRFATFGTVGSNHALATAIYARQLGYECTCFLAHQAKVPTVVPALCMHARLGTEIVRYGGGYSARINTLRKYLWNRDAWVIPIGGSSWVGTLGFVNAGLELATQVSAGEIPLPARVYVATGTMGTAAGLALGLALAGMRSEIQAVRVSDMAIANEPVLQRLMRKTATMMHRLDRSVPADLAERARIRLRHDFFAGGYARSDERTADAIRLAADQLDLRLESTYTGKAMAALLNDCATAGECLFWSTWNSAELPRAFGQDTALAVIPQEFRSYFD
ncbi:MAG TPA: pyridoxal-phosphate dependent enzyme [Woeseiaceae bacterium]|nr:pyridoxal-phosphate dependent enzyme [Woeseiaceae bacterium]